MFSIGGIIAVYLGPFRGDILFKGWEPIKPHWRKLFRLLLIVIGINLILTAYFVYRDR
jgi:hypothetical protein